MLCVPVCQQAPVDQSSSIDTLDAAAVYVSVCQGREIPQHLCTVCSTEVCAVCTTTQSLVYQLVGAGSNHGVWLLCLCTLALILSLRQRGMLDHQA